MPGAPRWRVAPLLAIALLIAGCGGGSSSNSADDAARTMTDAKGATVSVPGRAARVLALSEPTLDATLALGITPVATTAGRGQSTLPSYLRSRTKAVANVGALGSPNLEQVAGLHPDLILIDGTAFQDQAVMSKLERIAPTVYVSKTGESWRTSLQRTAEAVGREREGKQVLADYDAEVASIKHQLGANADATVSVVRWTGIGLPAMILKELLAGRVLTDLGLRRPAAQDEDGPGHSVPVSLEELTKLDADWIFLGALGAGGGDASPLEVPADADAAQTALDAAHDTPGWDDLKAVKAGHVVPVDGSAWTSAGGPLAARAILADVRKTLAR